MHAEGIPPKPSGAGLSSLVHLLVHLLRLSPGLLEPPCPERLHLVEPLFLLFSRGIARVARFSLPCVLACHAGVANPRCCWAINGFINAVPGERNAVTVECGRDVLVPPLLAHTASLASVP